MKNKKIKKSIALISLTLVMCMTGCQAKTYTETYYSEVISSVVSEETSSNAEDVNLNVGVSSDESVETSTIEEDTNSKKLINGIDWDSIEPASQDDFEFYLNDYDHVVITKYIGDDENVKIPVTINEREVVGLSYYTKRYQMTSLSSIYGVFARSNVKNVYISDGIRLLGDNCFYDSANLLSVYIPDSVVSIGAYAFGRCVNLKKITIPYGITEIEERTFEDCEKLCDVILPVSLKSIGKNAFHRCRNLIEIIIPDKVTEISAEELEDAFNGCEFLKRATYKVKDYDYRHIDDLYAAING